MKNMISALMAEYKRSIMDLEEVLKGVSHFDFEQIIDSKTKDPDCVSIKTIVFHLVQSGHTYANYLNSIMSEDWIEYERKIDSINDGISELYKMLDHTNEVLDRLVESISTSDIEKWSVKNRWNVTYDFEQLMEHAIVHILRHRRQIENFKKLPQ